MNDLVSIIVPIYNTEKYLRKCIESLINQQYKNIEIILVNDGSKDHSLHMCKEFSRKDNRIKIVNQNNMGLSAARNNGIKVAKGKFLMFVDGDDYVSPEFVSAALLNQKKWNSDIVIFNYDSIYDDKVEKYCQKAPEGIVPKERAMELIIDDSHAWNKLYKKELFNNIRYPVYKNYEDIFTTYRLFDIAKKISYVNDSTYFYIHRQMQGISIKRDPKNVEDLFSASLNRYMFLKKTFPRVAVTAQNSLLRFALIFLIYKDKTSNQELVNIAKKLLKNVNMTSKLSEKYKIIIRLYNIFPNATIRAIKKHKN